MTYHGRGDQSLFLATQHAASEEGPSSNGNDIEVEEASTPSGPCFGNKSNELRAYHKNNREALSFGRKSRSFIENALQEDLRSRMNQSFGVVRTKHEMKNSDAYLDIRIVNEKASSAKGPSN